MGNPEFLVPIPSCSICRFVCTGLRSGSLLALIGSSRTMQTWNRSAILLGLGVICLVVALAQPRDGYEELQLAREHRDIVVVLDVSQSMLAQDVLPSRMERARWEIRSLLEQLKGERVALCCLPSVPMFVCRFPKYAVLENYRREPSQKYYSARIGFGDCDSKADLFSQEDGARSIVLVSDGEDHRRD